MVSGKESLLRAWKEHEEKNDSVTGCGIYCRLKPGDHFCGGAGQGGWCWQQHHGGRGRHRGDQLQRLKARGYPSSTWDSMPSSKSMTRENQATDRDSRVHNFSLSWWEPIILCGGRLFFSHAFSHVRHHKCGIFTIILVDCYIFVVTKKPRS